jgi:L-arabonate dehydrase
VIKPSATDPALLQHTGRAVVFEDYADLQRRLADPDLDIDATCVMVLKNTGPRGFPGMPELGNMPLPVKLLQQGVTDMVRISDARMSGTAFGAVVLHISPESAVGGPLALVKDGDQIELNVPERRLSVLLSDDELARRRAAWAPRAAKYSRGYAKLFVDHVNQAHEGADFDFLVGASGPGVETDSH